MCSANRRPATTDHPPRTGRTGRPAGRYNRNMTLALWYAPEVARSVRIDPCMHPCPLERFDERVIRHGETAARDRERRFRRHAGLRGEELARAARAGAVSRSELVQLTAPTAARSIRLVHPGLVSPVFG